MSASLHRPGDVPTLETERLVLRGHRVGDFEEAVSMWGDPRITRFIGGRAFTREDVWGRLLRYRGLWLMLGYGYWAIEDKITGRFIGELGFADFKRDIEPCLRGMPEAGWALAAHAHGKGLATEALRAALAWGDGHFGSIRTACIINPENEPSVRVARKCGYREWRRTTYKDKPAVIFVRGA